MLTVTERAKEELAHILASVNIEDREVGLRLALGASGQFRLVPDREKKADQIVEHEGSKVLLVGSELTDAVDGVTIDYQETAEGPRLVISRE